jgi:hypothetical protein
VRQFIVREDQRGWLPKDWQDEKNEAKPERQEEIITDIVVSGMNGIAEVDDGGLVLAIRDEGWNTHGRATDGGNNGANEMNPHRHDAST